MPWEAPLPDRSGHACIVRNRLAGTTMTQFTWEHIHLRSLDPDATAAWY